MTDLASTSVKDALMDNQQKRINALQAKIEKLRAALKLGRQCVLESFDYVKSTDDQYLADARLRDIDAALGDEQKENAGHNAEKPR